MAFTPEQEAFLAALAQRELDGQAQRAKEAERDAALQAAQVEFEAKRAQVLADFNAAVAVIASGVKTVG